MVEQDARAVFLNLAEFGERRNIWYDGVLYEGVPVVLTGLKENDRKRLVSGVKEQGGRNSVADRVTGLYMRNVVMHVMKADIGGDMPENGQRMRISTAENPEFMLEYYVVASVEDMGMLRVELGGLDE